jgi:hypothetical protein
MEQELMHRPMPKATTQAMTQPATTNVVDIQLQRSVDVMMAWLVFGGGSKIIPQLASTQPSTQEASAATTAPTTAPAKPARPTTRPAAPASIPTTGESE